MNNLTVFNSASKVSSPEKAKIIQSEKNNHFFKKEEKISSDMISIVIPVKNNQKGIDRLLESFLACTESAFFPKEIIIVDNNSDEPLAINCQFPVPIYVLRCEKKGPAAARNMGISKAIGEWILFIDSDCVFSSSSLKGYLCDNCDAIAYAGKVKITGKDVLSNFYRDQNAFHPMSMVNENTGVMEPCTLVTANCLILKSALDAISGFNEQFIYAGGEDTDLGYRLKRIGKIQFNHEAETLHEMDDGFMGLIKRYIRYGKGNKMLQDLYKTDFFPQHFLPNNPSLINRAIAFVTVEAMRYGYKNAK